MHASISKYLCIPPMWSLADDESVSPDVRIRRSLVYQQKHERYLSYKKLEMKVTCCEIGDTAVQIGEPACMYSLAAADSAIRSRTAVLVPIRPQSMSSIRLRQHEYDESSEFRQTREKCHQNIRKRRTGLISLPRQLAHSARQLDSMQRWQHRSRSSRRTRVPSSCNMPL